MDDEGLPQLLGDRDLPSECLFLGGVGRVVVVEVEACLSDSDYGRVGARVAIASQSASSRCLASCG